MRSCAGAGILLPMLRTSRRNFFARLLRRQSFGAADRERGRCRSYLLGALDYFLTDHLRKTTAQKRGGTSRVLSLDAEECEAWFREQPSSEVDAARAFDQRWALVLMDRAMEALRTEYENSGRKGAFDAVLPFLGADTGSDGYDVACVAAGMTPEAFTLAVYRLRKRFRAKVREQIAMTVSDPAEADDEMRYLFGV